MQVLRTNGLNFCILLLALVFGHCANSQTLSTEQILEKLQLNAALYPPQDILSTKSLVLLSVPEDDNSSEWRESVDELQQFFAEQGIDAVAYVHQKSLLMLPNQVQPLPNYLANRGIKNIILFYKVSAEGPVFLAFGPYNEKPSLFSQSATFWARTGSELPPILSELDTYFKTGALRRENLLVNDSPEFFGPQLDSDGLTARSIPSNIAKAKVALNKLNVGLYNQAGAQRFSQAMLFNESNYLNKLTDRDQMLQSVGADSTNTITYLDAPLEANELRRAGYDLVLSYVTTTAEQMVNFFPSKNADYAFEGYQTKFYLSDLRTNTRYIGKEWDANADWQTALFSFLAQIKARMAEASD